jgi:putative tryptophan/tyrosine transport system substrate-binding protein
MTLMGAMLGAMRRRDFIRLAGAAAWPLAARAQQGERMRRVAVLMSNDNPEQRTNHAAFLQSLKQLGWVDGQNVRIETLWADGTASLIRKNAINVLAFAPDVVAVSGNSTVVALSQATRTVPIVFAQVADPVGSGFVKTMARPGGNVTGFVQFDYSLSGKWPELLKQIAPNVTRAAVLRDANIPAGIGQFAVIQAMAPSLGLEVSAINELDEDNIEREVIDFAMSPNGGLIVTASALSITHLELIVALAAKHKLPAIYYRRYYVDRGGLISYGYDVLQQFRGAADYVDRILKGTKPANLPVQAPNKYDLVINLKTAKALGLTVPLTLLARADEVIE